MMQLRVVAVATAIAATPATLAAQASPAGTESSTALDSPIEIYAFGGISVPTGDFADDTGLGSGAALTSIAAGVDVVVPLGTPGLGWASSASLVANGVDEDVALQTLFDEYGVPLDSDIDAGSYFSVPLMTGLRYELQASPTMTVFGMGQLGITILRGPTASVSNDSTDGEGEVEWDMARMFGFAFGGGVMFNERFGLTVRYLPLGEVEPEGTFSTSGTGADFEEELTLEDIPVSTFLLGATIRF